MARVGRFSLETHFILIDCNTDSPVPREELIKLEKIILRTKHSTDPANKMELREARRLRKHAFKTQELQTWRITDKLHRIARLSSYRWYLPEYGNVKARLLDRLKSIRASDRVAQARPIIDRFLDDIVPHYSPTTPERHIGLELECIIPANQEIIRRELLAKKLHRHVSIVDDGSIKPGGYRVETILDGYSFPGDYRREYSQYDEQSCAVELRLLTTQRNFRRDVAGLCSVATTLGGFVNNSCGLHVHLDCRQVKYEDVYRRLVRALPIFACLVDELRLHNTYCVLNSYATLSMHQRYSSHRYYAINSMSQHKGSIEVRLHDATLDPERISNWIELLSTIAYRKQRRHVDANSPREFLAQYKLPKHLRDYVRAHGVDCD